MPQPFAAANLFFFLSPTSLNANFGNSSGAGGRVAQLLWSPRKNPKDMHAHSPQCRIDPCFLKYFVPVSVVARTGGIMQTSSFFVLS